MSAHRTLTRAELLTEAKERFGDDPMDWAFQCPNCDDVATGRDFKEALAPNPDVHASSLLGQECIGRTLGALNGQRGSWTGRGCDWVAYGLFAGPWTVTLPDGHTISSFRLAVAKVAAS